MMFINNIKRDKKLFFRSHFSSLEPFTTKFTLALKMWIRWDVLLNDVELHTVRIMKTKSSPFTIRICHAVSFGKLSHGDCAWKLSAHGFKVYFAFTSESPTTTHQVTTQTFLSRFHILSHAWTMCFVYALEFYNFMECVYIALFILNRTFSYNVIFFSYS